MEFWTSFPGKYKVVLHIYCVCFLFCISIVTGATEHPFMPLLAISVTSFRSASLEV